jgi:hypothetical protein
VSDAVTADFAEMEKKLKLYVEKGRIAGGAEIREEPMIAVSLDPTLIRPLKRTNTFSGGFVAVDCSTRTLKRANNWGVYLMRVSHASVRERDVDWGYKEHICTVVGDAYSRSNFLKDVRIELESQAASELLGREDSLLYHDHRDSRSNYLLLDGGGYFGGERKFRVALYEKCEKAGINLLAISKNSPSLHDEKGRDLLAATSVISPHDVWVYYPVRKADKDKSLYGDITITKLCKESRHVFRCDVMEYLTDRDVSEILSPLTCISEDPRCIGYPIALWLAHEFSRPSDSMLISYHDQIEETLRGAGLLETLRREELSCSFADEIHGIKHTFDWEWWDGQF